MVLPMNSQSQENMRLVLAETKQTRGTGAGECVYQEVGTVLPLRGMQGRMLVAEGLLMS